MRLAKGIMASVFLICGFVVLIRTSYVPFEGVAHTIHEAHELAWNTFWSQYLLGFGLVMAGLIAAWQAGTRDY